MSNDNNHNDKDSRPQNEKHANDRSSEADHDLPIPPPVPPPTPPPQSSRNSSSLLSPWWSAEPPPEKPPAQEDPEKAASPGHLLVHFCRTATFRDPNESTSLPTELFREQCFMLAKKPQQNSDSETMDNPTQVEAEECRMVCFLRENEERRAQRREEAKTKFWNPLHGTWLVVATTQERCREHTSGILFV